MQSFCHINIFLQNLGIIQKEIHSKAVAVIIWEFPKCRNIKNISTKRLGIKKSDGKITQNKLYRQQIWMAVKQ